MDKPIGYSLTEKPDTVNLIEELNNIVLEENWGTVDRIGCLPKSVVVINWAIGEINKLNRALDIASNNLAMHICPAGEVGCQDVDPEDCKKCCRDWLLKEVENAVNSR